MTLEIGIVGAGNIAQSRHLPTYKNDSRTKIAGVYDKNKERAKKVAEEYDARAVGSLGELTAIVDLISICTPPSVHCKQAVTAMNNGCHVITEKPMAMSPAEADEMIATAERTNQAFSVVHNFQFMKKIRKARSIVASGEVGAINQTYAILIKREGQGKDYVTDEKKRGNIGIKFWDEAPHMMYLTRAFVGNTKLDSAKATRRDDGDGFKKISAIFKGENDSVGNVSFVWNSPISEWWLILICEEGILFVDIYRNLVVKFDREESHSALRVIKVLLSSVKQLTVGGLSAGFRYLHDRFVYGYRIPDSGFSYQIRAFVDSIETDSPPPVSGTEGKRVLEDMLKIGDAADIPFGLK